MGNEIVSKFTFLMLVQTECKYSNLKKIVELPLLGIKPIYRVFAPCVKRHDNNSNKKLVST